jgi:hypothetical protein
MDRIGHPACPLPTDTYVVLMMTATDDDPASYRAPLLCFTFPFLVISPCSLLLPSLLQPRRHTAFPFLSFALHSIPCCLLSHMHDTSPPVCMPDMVAMQYAWTTTSSSLSLPCLHSQQRLGPARPGPHTSICSTRQPAPSAARNHRIMLATNGKPTLRHMPSQTSEEGAHFQLPRPIKEIPTTNDCHIRPTLAHSTSNTTHLP